MKDFLIKIKLIDYMTIELDTDKTTFVSKLTKYVDKSDINWFSDSFDAFSSSKNDYKGQVTLNGFVIKKRKRMFDRNLWLAIARGSFRQNGDKLLIDIELNGVLKTIIVVLAMMIFFYIGFIAVFITSDNSDFHFPAAGFIVFIVVHAAMMIGIPYWGMRSSIARLKSELERDLFYYSKK